MALGPAYSVHIENHPDSFGKTMNDIRSWLDHHKIQPSLFKAADRGAGFEIAFNSQDETCLFEREFAALIQPVELPA